MDELEDKYELLRKRAESVRTKRQLLEENRQNYKDELKQLRHDKKVLKRVEELYKYLLDRYVNQYAESISGIVTEGLSSIFHDQDLEFGIEVSQKHGKVWVEFLTTKGAKTASALDSFGGGIVAVESLLLRILILLKTGLARYLILDESLASLSSEYVENCGNFVRKMCSELDVDLLLVTHNQDFVEYADTAYKAKPVRVTDPSDPNDYYTILEELDTGANE